MANIHANTPSAVSLVFPRWDISFVLNCLWINNPFREISICIPKCTSTAIAKSFGTNARLQIVNRVLGSKVTWKNTCGCTTTTLNNVGIAHTNIYFRWITKNIWNAISESKMLSAINVANYFARKLNLTIITNFTRESFTVVCSVTFIRLRINKLLAIIWNRNTEKLSERISFGIPCKNLLKQLNDLR